MSHAMAGGGGPLRRLWSAYERQLQRNPIATQMTTSFLLWGVGDALAQRIEHMEASATAAAAASAAAAEAAAANARSMRDQAKQARGTEVAASAAPEGMHYDAYRLFITALFGAVFVGPVGHFWYHGLDKWCAHFFKPNTARFIAAKVTLDTITMGPMYVAAFFAWGSAFIDRNGSWSDFTKKMRRDFVPTLAAEFTFWPLVQTANFLKVPVQHQLLVVNSMTVVDAAFMSWARNQDDWFGRFLAWVAESKAAKEESKKVK